MQCQLTVLFVWTILTLAAPAQDVETIILPRAAQQANLIGQWTRRPTMWEDATLVYRWDHRDLRVLDAGASTSRLVWKFPHRAWTRLSGMTWSSDGSALYAWLDVDQQLVRMNVADGSFESLIRLDTEIWNEKGDRRLAINLVDHPQGVIEDVENGLLLFTLEEDFNDEVSFWRRRSGRGGASLVCIDLAANRSLQSLSPKRVLPDSVESWDLSLARQRLWIVGRPRGKMRFEEIRAIEERRFNGQLVRALPRVEGLPEQLRLSPDQRTLLVQRRYKPEHELPKGKLDEISRDELKALKAQRDGGFVLIDVESHEVVDGPHDGSEASWSPDGRTIAFADGWKAKLYLVDEGSERLLIDGYPSGSEAAWHTWSDLTWSADGRRLALTAGTMDYTLLLDLQTHEYVVLGERATQTTWTTIRRPFEDG